MQNTLVTVPIVGGGGGGGGGAIDLDLQGQIEFQIQNLPHFELVYAITRHQLKLQKCILALFRSILILGLIEIDLHFNF